MKEKFKFLGKVALLGGMGNGKRERAQRVEIYIYTNRKTERKKDKKTDIVISRGDLILTRTINVQWKCNSIFSKSFWKDRQTNIPTDRQTDRQTDRPTDRHCGL